MRKYILIVVLALLTLIGTANAENRGRTPHNFIASAIDSVCRIEIYQGDNKVGAGSGFVVETNAKVTKIITARHVVQSASKCGIILHGKEYFTSQFFQADITDAAMILVEPSIPHAVALKFNLNYNNNITQVNAFGFWGKSKIPGTPQMVTMTTGWVDRKVVLKYGGPDYRVIGGVIFGNVLIFPGYSGGPILDNQMRVVGVNIILSQRHTIFVDSRFLWNTIANLNKGKKVGVPFDFKYDVLNTGSHSRVSAAINDVIKNGDEETTIGELQDMIHEDVFLNGRPSYPPPFQMLPSDEIRGLFNNETILIIGENKYLIASIAIAAEGLRKTAYESPHPSVYKYIYLVQNGAEVVIELAELPEGDKLPEPVEKHGVFFRNLIGRHFR